MTITMDFISMNVFEIVSFSPLLRAEFFVLRSYLANSFKALFIVCVSKLSICIKILLGSILKQDVAYVHNQQNTPTTPTTSESECAPNITHATRVSPATVSHPITIYRACYFCFPILADKCILLLFNVRVYFNFTLFGVFV